MKHRKVSVDSFKCILYEKFINDQEAFYLFEILFKVMSSVNICI